jgi:uncharacterized protein YfaP (DUF2135 family)
MDRMQLTHAKPTKDTISLKISKSWRQRDNDLGLHVIASYGNIF